MSSRETKRMPISEFRALGWVQEINRLMLHPAGLALEVIVEEDGTERLGGVWDCRDDPEGLYFGDLDADAAARARALVDDTTARNAARRAALGFFIEPLPRAEDASAWPDLEELQREILMRRCHRCRHEARFHPCDETACPCSIDGCGCEGFTKAV